MTPEEARAKLEEYRVLIDDVDRRIVALLNERTQVVEEIGRVKHESEMPIYEPKREEQVFANITGSNAGPDDVRTRCAASSSASSTKCARFSVCGWNPGKNERMESGGKK